MQNIGYSLRILLPVMLVGFVSISQSSAQSTVNKESRTGGPNSQSGAILEGGEANKRSGILEEVFVTANLRSESIQDVAGSVSGFDDKLLKDLGTDNIGDLAKFTPSLSNRDRGPGNNDFNIRGIGRVTNLSDATPTPNPVAMYLDDVSVNTVNSGGVDIDFFGLARAEILRGAQGTLYGESAQGGAIKFYSRDPSMEEFNGQAEIDASRGYSDSGKISRGAKVLMDIPLIENRLGMVLTGNYTKNKGYIDNVREDTPDSDTNEYQSYNARGVFLANITDNFSARLAAHYHKLDLNSGQHVDDLEPGSSTPRPKISLQTADDWQDDRALIVPLKLTYEFDNFAIQSISAYYTRDVSYDKFESLTAMFASLVLNPAVTGHFADGHVDFASEYEQKTHEIKFISNWESPFSVVGGVYYRKSENLTKARGYTKDNPGLTVYRGSVDDNGNDTSKGSTQVSKQTSYYGELTWDISERWSATVGVRRHKEDLENFSDSVSLIIVDDPAAFVTSLAGVPVPLSDLIPVNTPIAALTAPPITQSLDLKKWLPMARIQYQPSDDSLYYFRYSTGLRAGNVNSAILLYGNAVAGGDPSQFNSENPDNYYGPDFVKAYELGAKLTFLEGALTVNSSLYHNDWKDLQVFFGKPLGLTKNASAAVTNGLEVESFLALSENLFVFLSGSMSGKAELTEPFKTGTTGSSPTVPAGAEIAYVQRYAYSAGLAYRHIWDNDLMFNSSLSYSFTGPYKFLLTELEDTNNDAGRIKQVNASIDIGTERWKVTLKGSNLFNDYAVIAFTPGTKSYELLLGLPAPEGESIDTNFVNSPRLVTLSAAYFF